MLEETDKYSDKGADNALFSYAKEKRKVPDCFLKYNWREYA